jgi:hypothetical protein
MAQGKGLFSAIGGYVQGMGLGTMGRAASMLTSSGQAGYNMGQLANYAAKSAWSSNTGKGAILGAAAGGAYGATSDDTSILGGMAMGAGLGAGAGRYGGTGFRAASSNFMNPNSKRGVLSSFGRGAKAQFLGDIGRIKKFGAGQKAASKTVAATATTPQGASLATNKATVPITAPTSVGATLASNTPAPGSQIQSSLKAGPPNRKARKAQEAIARKEYQKTKGQQSLKTARNDWARDNIMQNIATSSSKC